MENEYLKKSRSLIRADATVAQRCALIDAERANYSITGVMLDVARSSFYAWYTRAETATALRRRELAQHVERVFDASRGTYGCRGAAPRRLSVQRGARRRADA
jgi:hypothetical protein